MTSTNIYKFKPTYLYIKQHSITGKLYFGKTIKNPENYFGSGVHWKRHIEKHGKEHVLTVWYCLYYNEIDIKDAATSFSNIWNVTESKDWLNIIPENGTNGGSTSETNGFRGKKHTKEYLLHRKNTLLDPEKQKQKGAKVSKALKGKSKSNTENMKNSHYNKNRHLYPNFYKKETVTCPFCKKQGKVSGGMSRFHFENCRMKPTQS